MLFQCCIQQKWNFFSTWNIFLLIFLPLTRPVERDCRDTRGRSKNPKNPKTITWQKILQASILTISYIHTSPSNPNEDLKFSELTMLSLTCSDWGANILRAGLCFIHHWISNNLHKYLVYSKNKINVFV